MPFAIMAFAQAFSDIEQIHFGETAGGQDRITFRKINKIGADGQLAFHRYIGNELLLHFIGLYKEIVRTVRVCPGQGTELHVMGKGQGKTLHCGKIPICHINGIEKLGFGTAFLCLLQIVFADLIKISADKQDQKEKETVGNG